MREYLEYLPPYLREINEIKALSKATDPHTQSNMDHLIQTYWNQYVVTMDEKSMRRWERLFEVKAATGETMEFRRKRLINRFCLKSPITMWLLFQRLDAILGEDNYTVDMDFHNYTIYIETAQVNQYWFEEIHVMMHKIKPANIVFMNRPRIEAGLLMNERADKAKVYFNYKLGTIWSLGLDPFVSYGYRDFHYALGAWVLGEKPFTTLHGYNYELGNWPLGEDPFVNIDLEAVKMETTPSIQQELIKQTAGFVLRSINSVLLNHSYPIEDFTLSSSGIDSATIGYPVPFSSGIEAITNIKLLDVDGKVLSSSDVYIPLFSDIAVHHKIFIKEGILNV